MLTYEEFAGVLRNATTEIRPQLTVALTKIGEEQSYIAKEMIGEEHEFWTPLKPATTAAKERAGYAVPAPLLREGTLRDSISFEVEPGLLEVTTGSNDKVALYQEMGTSRIPPRPFLSRSAVEVLPLAERAIGEAAAAIWRK